MSEYVVPGNDPSLYPDAGYAVVQIDEFKSPDDDGFVTVLSEFDDDSFELPPEEEGYTYVVHTAGGETITRDEWEGNDG